MASLTQIATDRAMVLWPIRTRQYSPVTRRRLRRTILLAKATGLDVAYEHDRAHPGGVTVPEAHAPGPERHRRRRHPGVRPRHRTPEPVLHAPDASQKLICGLRGHPGGVSVEHMGRCPRTTEPKGTTSTRRSKISRIGATEEIIRDLHEAWMLGDDSIHDGPT